MCSLRVAHAVQVALGALIPGLHQQPPEHAHADQQHAVADWVQAGPLVGKEARVERVIAAEENHQVREHGAIRRQAGEKSRPNMTRKRRWGNLPRGLTARRQNLQNASIRLGKIERL